MNNQVPTPGESNPAKLESEFENEAHYKEVDNEILNLVREAKARPLPKSTKALAVITIFAVIFTGGVLFGKMKATPSTTTGLSLAGIGGQNAVGGFGGGGFGGGGFGGGRNRGGNGAGAVGQGIPGTAPAVAPEIVVNLPVDVVGTVVSISAKEIVIETLSGEKQTFPITATTKVRESSKIALPSVKAGDIVTVKPETDKSAKTVTIVK
jgi:hypothetical protein